MCELFNFLNKNMCTKDKTNISPPNILMKGKAIIFHFTFILYFLIIKYFFYNQEEEYKSPQEYTKWTGMNHAELRQRGQRNVFPVGTDGCFSQERLQQVQGPGQDINPSFLLEGGSQ
jgi:hypothetical protein